MFRLEHNVPQVYIEQSRDFQLLCRLYDCINNAVRYDINSMLSILDPMKISDRLLNLMCTKVGFFTNRNYDSLLLRYILAAFPFALKYKGSKHGIEIAVSAILKAESEFRVLDDTKSIDSLITIDNTQHCVRIYTTVEIINKSALKDFLKYIMPIGYTHTIETNEIEETTTILYAHNEYRYMTSPTVSTSLVRGSDRILDQSENANPYDFKTEMEDNYISTIGHLEIIGSDNIESDEAYDLDRNNTNRDTIDKSENVDVSELNKEE